MTGFLGVMFFVYLYPVDFLHYSTDLLSNYSFMITFVVDFTALQKGSGPMKYIDELYLAILIVFLPVHLDLLNVLFYFFVTCFWSFSKMYLTVVGKPGNVSLVPFIFCWYILISMCKNLERESYSEVSDFI